MNKFFIALVFLIFTNLSTFAEEPLTARKLVKDYQKAKETTDEDFLTNIETYFAGISKGVTMSNLYSGVIGNGNFFCPPKDKRFAPDEMVDLIIQFESNGICRVGFYVGKSNNPNEFKILDNSPLINMISTEDKKGRMLPFSLVANLS